MTQLKTSSGDHQLKLFYTNILYDNLIQDYYHHYTGTGYDNGKRSDDVLYYTCFKKPHHFTLSDETLETLLLNNVKKD